MNTDDLDQLLAEVSAHKLEANIADLVRLDPLGTTNTVTNTHWTTLLLMATAVTVVLMVVYYCTCTHGKVLLRCCVKKKSRSPTLDPVQAGSSPQILPSSTPTLAKDCPSTSDAHLNFTTYAVQTNWTHKNTRNSEADSHVHIVLCSVECWNFETQWVLSVVVLLHTRNKNECLCVVAKHDMQFKCSGRVERGYSRPSDSRFTSDNMQARNIMQS